MMDPFQNFAPDDPHGAIAQQSKGRAPPQAALDWFAAQDVSALNLVKTWHGYTDIVLHDDVVFLDDDKSFEFANPARHDPDDIEHALTFVAWDAMGAAIDICAWQAMSGRIALWRGAAAMLGEDNLFGPRLDGGLYVHLDLVDWFRAGRSGVVILDKERAVRRLRDEGTLIATGPEQARAIKNALRQKQPTILIPGEAAA